MHWFLLGQKKPVFHNLDYPPATPIEIQESIVNWAYMNITNPYGMESQWCFTLNASSSVLSSPI